MYRTNYVEIDLEAVRHNARQMLARLSEGTRLMAVVKADAYGHGAVQVAQAALEAGASALAVAIPEEGECLRAAGIAAPILVLGGIEPDAAGAVVRCGLTQTVFDARAIAALSQAAQRLNRPARVHLKLDTGMSRIGVRTAAQAAALAQAADEAPGVRLVGAFTHFASADEEDASQTQQQIARFEDMLRAVEAVHGAPLLRHACNSAGIYRYPQAHYDMVRGGIALYGCAPAPGIGGLRPAMRWTTRATFVKDLPAGERISYGGTYTAARDMRVMTVPVGYADGYRRAFSGRAQVLVRGRRAPVVGRVCMDQMMVDVTDIPAAAAGDAATVFGGDVSDSVETLAHTAGTIPYEILCSIGRRVPRVYLDGGREVDMVNYLRGV